MICQNGHIKIAYDPTKSTCPLCATSGAVKRLAKQVNDQHLEITTLTTACRRGAEYAGRMADALTVRNLELAMAKDEIDQLRSDLWLLSVGGGHHAR